MSQFLPINKSSTAHLIKISSGETQPIAVDPWSLQGIRWAHATVICMRGNGTIRKI